MKTLQALTKALGVERLPIPMTKNPISRILVASRV
jgi:hypothetical protein